MGARIVREVLGAVCAADGVGAARAVWSDSRRHPFSLAQNALGSLIAAATPGRAGDGPACWRFIDGARGLGGAIPRWFGQEAITLGCHTFSAVPLERNSALFWHEYRHYRQSTAWRPAFIPAYLLVQALCGYQRNPFEQDAARWGRAMAERQREQH